MLGPGFGSGALQEVAGGVAGVLVASSVTVRLASVVGNVVQRCIIFLMGPVPG